MWDDYSDCRRIGVNIRNMEDAKVYWLHLSSIRVPGTTTTYTMSRTNDPRIGTGGACPTVHHSSWEILLAKLRHINVREPIIKEAGEELQKSGHYILQDIRLTHQQLVDLEFPDVI